MVHLENVISGLILRMCIVIAREGVKVCTFASELTITIVEKVDTLTWMTK